MFILCNCYVGVGYDRRWNEDRRPRWELDNKVKVPENEMTPFPVVVGSKGGDSTPTKGGIKVVEVRMCYGSRP